MAGSCRAQSQCPLLWHAQVEPGRLPLSYRPNVELRPLSRGSGIRALVNGSLPTPCMETRQLFVPGHSAQPCPAAPTTHRAGGCLLLPAGQGPAERGGSGRGIALLQWLFQAPGCCVMKGHIHTCFVLPWGGFQPRGHALSLLLPPPHVSALQSPNDASKADLSPQCFLPQ